MRKALLFGKSNLRVRTKAKLIRNRQFHMRPLGRLSQGTRYIDAPGRDAPTYRRRWRKEVQEARHELRLAGTWKQGEQKASSFGGGEEMGPMCPLHPHHYTQNPTFPAPVPQR